MAPLWTLGPGRTLVFVGVPRVTLAIVRDRVSNSPGTYPADADWLARRVVELLNDAVPIPTVGGPGDP